MNIRVYRPVSEADPPVAYALEAVHHAGKTLANPVEIVIGTAASDDLPTSIADAVPAEAESSVLTTEGGVLYVVGRDMRGVVFGLFRLADRISVLGDSVRYLDEIRTPVFRTRMMVDAGLVPPPGTGPEGLTQFLIEWGCNECSLGTIAGLADPGEIDSRLVTDTEQSRTQTENARKNMRQQLAMFRRWLIDPELDCAPFLDLDSIYEYMIDVYGDAVSEDGVTVSQALDKPWEIWRALVDQVLTEFPEFTHVRSSMGDFSERYMIWHDHGPKSEALGPAGGMRRFYESARSVVVDKHNRNLIVSGWGNPPDTYPLNNPNSLREVFRGCFRGEGVSLLSNECEHDFYLNSPFNDNFGVSEVDHGVMFQMQREYQGLGELPVYIGPRLRDRMAKCVKLGATEIATARLWWSRNLHTDGICWTWWNIYAWMQACWEPEGDPWTWARDCNRIRFGHAGAEALADVLMMTEELASRLFEMPGWSGSKRDAYAITHRCVFTDGRHYWRVMRDPQGEAYRDNNVRGQVLLLLEQIDATDQLSEAVLEKARQAVQQLESSETVREVLERFEHFHAVAGILTHYQRALLLWHYKDEPHLTEDKAVAARNGCITHAINALNGFGEYRKRWDLYKDGGMVPLLRWYLRSMQVDILPAPEDEVTLAIPYSQEPGGATLDGFTAPVLAEGNSTRAWPEAAYAENLQLVTSVGNPDEFGYSAGFTLSADRDALYARVDVVDPDQLHGIRADRLYRSDSVSLTFDTDYDGREDAIIYLLLDDETCEPVMLQVMKDMIQFSLNYEERDRSPENDPGADVRIWMKDDGYAWSATIPWTMLGGFDPTGDLPLGVSVIANNAAKTHPGFRLRMHYPDIPLWRDAPPVSFAYGRIV